MKHSATLAEWRRVTLEEIKVRRWSKSELALIDRLAASQALGAPEPAGTDEIPPLSDEQLKTLVRLRNVNVRDVNVCDVKSTPALSRPQGRLIKPRD